MFIGVRMDGAAVEAALDTALLSDAEFGMGGADAWSVFVDPFRLWGPSARDKMLSLLASDVADRVRMLEDLQKSADAISSSRLADRQALERKYSSLLLESWKLRASVLKDPFTSLPKFWLNAMLNHPDVELVIEGRDHAALKSLLDVSWEFLSDFEGFKLSFTFGPNDYFHDTVLTKVFYARDLIDGFEIGLRKSVG